MLAARWLGVPPWELGQQSVFWRDKALVLMRVLPPDMQKLFDR